jgi:hypothetical protein
LFGLIFVFEIFLPVSTSQINLARVSSYSV